MPARAAVGSSATPRAASPAAFAAPPSISRRLGAFFVAMSSPFTQASRNAGEAPRGSLSGRARMPGQEPVGPPAVRATLPWAARHGLPRLRLGRVVAALDRARQEKSGIGSGAPVRL